jgi:DNA primase
MQQPSDEIKSKLDIVDVIRDYIPLKPAGVNFRALCPFHHEKSPSFVVSPEKQIWHCFGCQKGGDIFSFVMEMDGLSFVDALRALAPKAGVVLKKQNSELTSQKNRILDVVEFAKNYYHKILLENPQAEIARKYLVERGLTDETIEEWQIGFSPDSWDDLMSLLIKKGFRENEIFQAGMSVKKEGAGKFYNRFRGRIMFPINDVNGNTVGFSARVSPDKEANEKLGKYINSPQTMIYDKSKILFGLDKAKQEIKKKNFAIIMEGQMDVITAHQNGYKNAIASSGTALTAEQVLLLKRYSENIALAFDMDKAGEMAADRGIKEAMRAEMNTKVILIPNGKDPDECIKNNKKEWEEAVKNAKPIMEYYFAKIFSGLDLKKVENKRASVKILLPIIARLENKIEKDFWLKNLSQKVEVREEILAEALRDSAEKVYVKKEESTPVAPVKRKQSREEMLSELFLALILKFPSIVEYAMNHAHPDQIVGDGNFTLYRNLIIYYNIIIDNWTQEGGQTEAPQVSYTGLKTWLGDYEYNAETSLGESHSREQDKNTQLKLLDMLVLLGDRDFYEYDSEAAKNEAIKLIMELKKIYLLKRKKEIEKLIPQAERENDDEKIKILMEEFQSLGEELREIED